MTMIFLSKYWKVIVIAVSALSMYGVIAYKNHRIASLSNDLRILTLEAALKNKESERLYNEYQANILKYNEAKEKTRTVYVDKVRYIKESVDENSTCEDVVDGLDRYAY